MFSKKRAVSNPSQSRKNPNPTPSAALAATQAFLKNQQSNASLSSAAAGAALQAHPSPPTRPGDVQTRRMIRRNSNSSFGSASSAGRPASGPAPGGRRELHRTNSSGSMTERSFRSPSPNNRNNNNNNNISMHDPDRPAPPVPQLPKDLQARSQARQRSSSLDPEPVARVASPPPRKQGGRGISVDTAARRVGQKQSGGKRMSVNTDVADYERAASPRSSINFSRPYSPAMSSPTSPSHSPGSGWHTGPVVTGNKLRHESPRKQSSKLAQSTQMSPTGSGVHTAATRAAAAKTQSTTGTRTSKPSAALVAAGLAGSRHAETFDDEEEIRESPATKAARAKHAAQARANRGPSPSTSRSANIEETEFEPSPAQLQKKPSIVYEDSQREELAELADRPAKFEKKSSRNDANAQPATKEPRKKKSATPITPEAKTLIPIETTSTNGAIRSRDRGSSISPSRNAHFSILPVEAVNGVKHKPPPRSVSPAKSALKHSPSTSLSASPARNRTGGSPDNTSEDGTRSVATKRRSRVSFDSEPVIAGLGVGPVTPISPTTGHFESDSEREEALKPTPTLPSFGSVRGRREGREAAATNGSPSQKGAAENLDASSDHAVGGIVARALAPKEKSNDPVPPEVTSVEGSGYVSDSSSADDQSEEGPTNQSTAASSWSQDASRQLDVKASANDGSLSPINETPEHAMAAPSIVLLGATPTKVEDANSRGADYFVPGGFPGIRGSTPSGSPPVDDKAADSDKDASAKGQPTADTESIDDDDSLLYTDAAEELTEDEGGFASLDAVLGNAIPSSSGSKPHQRSGSSDNDPPTPVQGISRRDTPYVHGQSGALDSDEEADNSDSTVTEVPQKSASAETPRSAEPEAKPKVTEAQSVPKEWPLTQKQEKTTSSKPKPSTAAVAASAGLPTQPKRRTKDTSDLTPIDTGRRRESYHGIPDTSPKETHMRKSMRPSSAGRSSASEGLSSSRHGTNPDPRGTFAFQKNTMRAGGETRGKTASRSPVATTRNSTVAAASAPSTKTASLQKKQPAPKPILKTPMPKTKSGNDSDSDASASSFQRERRRRPKPAGGMMTMRSTMRGSQPSRTTSPPAARPSTSDGTQSKASRFRLRSLSPAPSNGSDTRDKSMRASKRNTIDFSGPASPAASTMSRTMRGSNGLKAKSASPSGLGRFGKSREKSPKPTGKGRGGGIGSGFRSRFADSSDEDDDEPRKALPAFRSRFNDSDDDDDVDLTPVRGIPRRAGAQDGDSTDLEDSSDDGQSRRKKGSKGKAATLLGSPTSLTGRGSGESGGIESSKHAVTEGPGSIASLDRTSTQKKRRSFLGFGKKKESPVAVDPPIKPAPHRPTLETIPSAASVRSNSTATMDTTPSSPTNSAPRRGKLQRRNTPQFKATPETLAAQPVPEVPEPAEEKTSAPPPLTLVPPPKNPARKSQSVERPRTSDGPKGRFGFGSRPGAGKRLSSLPAMPSLTAAQKSAFEKPESSTAEVGPGAAKEQDVAVPSVETEEGKKKKRFKGLRKMFGRS